MDTVHMTATCITAPQIESAVHRYWDVLMKKAAGEMAKFYSYDSTVFNPFSQRAEPGRVSATRKEREYFTANTTFRAEVTGAIEVQMLADNIAVATYTFRWQASNMEQEVLGKRFDKAVRDGRATQVFKLSAEGELHIVNEHLSDIWRDTQK
jgi:ketosteroid isomerase-like protein